MSEKDDPDDGPTPGVEYDESRFAGTEKDITPLGPAEIEDHLTEEQKRKNAEHDRLVKAAFSDPEDDPEDLPD